MKRLLPFTLGLLLLAAFSSCVTPQSQGTTTAGGTGGAVMLINDRPITAEELITSPIIRPLLRQYITYNSGKELASSRGAAPDPSEIDQRVQELRQQFEEDGVNWQDFLREQSLTEDELRIQMSGQLYFEALVDTLYEITEQDLQDSWGKDQEAILDKYMRDNHLPESVGQSLTFDECRESIEEWTRNAKRFDHQQEAFDLLLTSTEISLTCIADSARRKQYEDLILNNIKPENRPVQPGEEAVEALAAEEPVEAPEGAPTPSAGPATGAGSAVEPEDESGGSAVEGTGGEDAASPDDTGEEEEEVAGDVEEQPESEVEPDSEPEDEPEEQAG